MKKLFITLSLFFITSLLSFSQYDGSALVFTGGLQAPKYLGHGEGDNYFSITQPGFQLEFTINDENNFEWILWGIAHFNCENVVESSKVPVSCWTPYYTEFLFYQKGKKNPGFIFFGYDYTRMQFPYTEKPDSHHNLSLGGGWNVQLINKIYLQFKIKPYFVLDNSLGQWFGTNFMINLHLGASN
jgi:hypothetical protein